MTPNFRKIYHSFLYLLYPPQCLHCGSGVYDPEDRFCEGCTSLLELIDPAERCPECFSSYYDPEIRYCVSCFKHRSYVTRAAAAFPYEGPARSIVRKMKYANQPYLAQGAASYMVAQFTRLDWPMPDLIVPVPMAVTHRFLRGYNQSVLLAQHIAEMLQRPMVEALHRSCGDYSQAGLSREQRESLDGSTITLRDKYDLRDRCLLLVDDVMTTGSTIKRCSEMLLHGCPNSIYSLTVCKT